MTLKGLSKSSLWSIALLKSNWTVIRQLIYGKVQSASRLTMLKCSPQPYLLKSSSSTTQSNLNLLNKYLEVENMTMSQLIWFCLTSSSDVKDIFSTSRTRAWHQRQCCFWFKAQVLDIKQISLIPMHHVMQNQMSWPIFFSSTGFKIHMLLFLPRNCHILDSVWSSVNRTITSTEELPAIAPIRPKMLKKLSKNCTNICQNNWKRTLVQRKNHFDV